MRLRTILVATCALAAISAAGVAYAGTREQPQLIPPGAPAGYLSIDGLSCRFVHPEIDVRPSATERLARTEDSRDDVKFQCLARRHTRYVRVSRGFDPQQSAGAVARCPRGYHAVGGGSTVEVAGSYPLRDLSAWVVRRDPAWRGIEKAQVFAVCAGVVA